jgi:hypothetical protein
MAMINEIDGFKKYPNDAEYYISLREEINKKLMA